MSGTNDFLPFATGGGANVEPQATYAADATRASGEVDGTANAPRANKAWRQSSFVAAALAQLVADSGANALDDGNLSTFVTNLKAAITQLVIAASSFPGEYKMIAFGAAPPGWLICNGASLLRAGTYANLFAAIGTFFGAVDGTHFNVPDMRGVVPRGVDDSRGLDPDRVLGTFQGDAVGPVEIWADGHNGDVDQPEGFGHDGNVGACGNIDGDDGNTNAYLTENANGTTLVRGVSHAAETRMANVAFGWFCIKY